MDNKSISVNLRYLKLVEIFDAMWNKELPKVPENERYTQDKDEIIEMFVKRLNVCDNFRPKVTDSHKITQDDISRIQIESAIRAEICEDIKKCKYAKEIEDAYFAKRSKISTDR